jgi:pimeloyl-ACP methyl ester carboxylesterase
MDQFVIAPTDVGRLAVNGCPIAYATWSGAAGPIVLVHGAGAHMGWWDGVIQQLVPRYRVIAVDLSGHGDSGRREDYNGEQWANEVLAVARSIGDRHPLVVGHSLGGRVSIVAGALEPDAVPGLVLVDAPIRRPRSEPRPRFQPRTADRRYESLDRAVESFHLLPMEPVYNHELLRRVAFHSFRRLDGSWGLKADRNVYGRIDDHDLAACLGRISAPITLVYGSRSVSLDDDGRGFLAESHRGHTQFVRIDGGFHHLTFDYASELAGAIASSDAELAVDMCRVDPG